MARTDCPLPHPLAAARVALRVVAIVVGAYAASAALVAAGVAAPDPGGRRQERCLHDLQHPGLCVYVALALWAAAVQPAGAVLFGTFGLITAVGAALGTLPALLGGT